MTAGRTNHRQFAAPAASQCHQVNDGMRCTAMRCPGERLCPDCNPGQPNLPPSAPARFITRSDSPPVPDEIDVAFELAMRGRQFGREETADARLWFSLGWIALQRKRLGLAYLVGPDDSQRSASSCTAEGCEQGCACPGDCLGAPR